MTPLMYGAGLRLMECLRVQDIDFARNEITVRDGQGAKDQITVLPNSLRSPPRLISLEGGYDIRTVQELLGHSDVKTTQEDVMLIRIRRYDNKSKETQMAVPAGSITAVFAVSTVCYTDRKPVFRVLCGSI